MGNDQAGVTPASSAPQDQVDIEHPAAPALAARAPAEFGFDPFDQRQEVGRPQGCDRDRRAIGIVPARRAERSAEGYPAAAFDGDGARLERRERGGEYPARRPEAPIADIGAERDQVALLAQMSSQIRP